jgi:nucleoside-diphosphate-sugar epimerase
MPRRVPDVAKIQSYLGWKSVVHLDEMIQRVLDYYSGLINDHRAFGSRRRT